VPRYILQGKRPKKENTPTTTSLESSLAAITPTPAGTLLTLFQTQSLPFLMPPAGGRSKTKVKRRKMPMSVSIFNDPVASFSYFSSQIKMGKMEDDEEEAADVTNKPVNPKGKPGNRSRGKVRGHKKKTNEDDEEEMDVESIMCTTCGGGEDEEKMLLCDGPGCENAYHMYCLSIPISAIPEGDWYCDECLEARREEEERRRRIAAGEKLEEEEDSDEWHEEFGFGEGKVFTLESFKKMADNFKRKWFRTESLNTISVAQAEEEFWRIVNTSEVRGGGSSSGSGSCSTPSVIRSTSKCTMEAIYAHQHTGVGSPNQQDSVISIAVGTHAFWQQSKCATDIYELRIQFT